MTEFWLPPFAARGWLGHFFCVLLRRALFFSAGRRGRLYGEGSFLGPGRLLVALREDFIRSLRGQNIAICSGAIKHRCRLRAVTQESPSEGGAAEAVELSLQPYGTQKSDRLRL